MKSHEGACLLPPGCLYLPAFGPWMCVNSTEGWVDAHGGRPGGLEPMSIRYTLRMQMDGGFGFLHLSQPSSHVSSSLGQEMGQPSWKL